MKLIKLLLAVSFLFSAIITMNACDGKSSKSKYKHPSVRASGH
jgi:hypothetical protein